MKYNNTQPQENQQIDQQSIFRGKHTDRSTVIFRGKHTDRYKI